jgi:hypothetical protein
MNIQGNDLAGDTVRLGLPISYPLTFTANLSMHAVASFTAYFTNATFNLSQSSSLFFAVTAGAHVGSSYATINLYGGDENLWLSNQDAQVTVNLLQGARWNGTLNMGTFFGQTYGKTTINGGPQAVWNNNGTSTIHDTENAVVGVDVIGIGLFDVRNDGGDGRAGSLARLEFGRTVYPYEFIHNSGLVVVDRPDLFHGYITLQSRPVGASGSIAAPAEVDLANLAHANAWSFQNDILRIYSGHVLLDQLFFTDHTNHGTDGSDRREADRQSGRSDCYTYARRDNLALRSCTVRPRSR